MTMGIMIAVSMIAVGQGLLAQTVGRRAETHATVPPPSQLLGPTLVLQDSVILEEGAETYVGDPLGFFVGPDTSFHILDGFGNQVIRFAKTGEFVRTYGRQGRGPGEFGFIGDVGFAYSDLMGVVDWRPPRLIFFDPESGRSLGSIRLSDFAHHSVWADVDRVWVTGIDETPGGWRAVAEIPVSALPGGDGEVVSRVASDRVSVPKVYVESMQIRYGTGSVFVSPGRDDLLIGFGASPFLLRVSRTGEVLDTLNLRAVKRRGVPADDDYIRGMDSKRYDDMGAYTRASFEMASLLASLSRGAEDDYVYTVHFDPVWRDSGGPVGLRGGPGGLRYVSSSKVDGSEPCPDTVVPTEDDGRVATRLRGNELFVLDQRIVAGAGHVRTVIRRFTIDPTRCTGEVLR
ncbi:MAG: hypothetical protein OXE96_02500 [Gemmatimonadetes bacterium]|nr:hypothetical protein [Gemmatimonadota bacterium]